MIVISKVYNTKFSNLRDELEDKIERETATLPEIVTCNEIHLYSLQALSIFFCI